MDDRSSAAQRHLEWGEEQRRRLRQARTDRRHSQPDCIEALEALGGPKISQPTLSQWESGVIARPPGDAITAIQLYCEAGGVPSRGDVPSDPKFSSVISPITGEAVLSDRQAQLVDAVLHRLRSSTGPMSPDDGEALRWAAGLLGLREPRGQPGRGQAAGDRETATTDDN